MKNSKRRKIASKTAKIRIVDCNHGAFEIKSLDTAVDGNLAARMIREARKAREGLDGKGEYAVYGNRLANICDLQLFKTLNAPNGEAFKNFGDFCVVVEKMSKSTVSRLISSARKVVALHDAGLVPPRTLAQIEPLLPLSDADAIKVLTAARTTAGNEQPSSLLVRKIANDLGLRKPRPKTLARRSNPLAMLIEELEKAVALPKHADLRELVARLRKALGPGKVADSATATPESGALPDVQPKAGSAVDAPSQEIPVIDRITVTGNKHAPLAPVIPLDSFNEPNGPDYVINTSGSEVHVRFRNGLACQKLKSTVPNWALEFRCGPDFEWVCKCESANRANDKRDHVVACFSKVGTVPGLSIKSHGR